MKKNKKLSSTTMSKAKQSLPTLKELNYRTQRISRAFYPDRTVEPDISLDDEERIRQARKLAVLYEKSEQPIPASLLILI